MTKPNGVFMRRVSTRTVFAVLICVTGISLARGQEYTVRDLGSLPGDTAQQRGNLFSEGLSVNIWGHVAGCSGTGCGLYPPSRGFFWSQGSGLRPLKPLSSSNPYTFAAGINDLDQIAGTAGISSSITFPYHAALWTKDGSVRDLGTLNKTCTTNCPSYAHAISDFGVVVGCSYIPPSPYDTLHAFLWTDDFGMRDLGALGFGSSCAVAVNLHAAVAGWLNTLATATNAFFWSPRGGMLNLGTLPGGEGWSVATGINDVNQVVGQSDYAGGDFHYSHAFLWSKATGMQDLGTISGNPNSSEAFAIDDLGDVVGESEYQDYGGDFHAFIWSRSQSMRDLNDLIDPSSGWVLTNATAIDILGQITGYGTLNGQTHAFLLTPRRR